MQRYDIINKLIKKYNYKTYLEIGTQHGNCFTWVDIPYKICVDPEKVFSGLTHEMTSDAFFEQNKETFDIIFIDGLHLEYQVTQDLINASKILNTNGSIVLHDCLPHSEDFTQVLHSGTVYKSIIQLRCQSTNVEIYTVDTDCGCTVVRRGSQSLWDKVVVEEAKKYSYYEANKKELMNVISVEEFDRLLQSTNYN